MRNLIVIFFLFISVQLSAQTLQSVTNSGNSTTRSVWIGMDSAAGVAAGVTQNTLNVGGKIKLLGVNSIYTSGSDANQPTIYRSGINTGSYPFDNYDNLILQAGTGNRDILFVTGLSPSEKVVIKGSGLVGMGTAAPNYNLHINSSANNSYLQLTSTVTGNTTSDGFIIGNGITGRVGLINRENTDIGFYTNNIEKLTITAGGSIGVGTTTPNYSVHVNSSNNDGYIQVTSATSGNTNFDGVILGTGLTGRAALINRENTDLAFSTNNIERMTLTAGGNLLIGKTTQGNSSYQLDVNGNIRANKVVVNTSGADFVFEEDYKLTQLDELEKYVRANHHLPGIAPAQEMQSNGVDVGDNQTKLLQKTEELTLYLIEQNKINKAQQEVIERQNSLLQSLQERINALEKTRGQS